MSGLPEIAGRTDAAVATARAELVAAVRQAAAEGMTQQEIGRLIGRSQPEVSRLLRFHGRSPLGRRLRSVRGELHRLVGEAGGADLRVFGSVARGEDGAGSDIDLLFRMGTPLSLMELSALEDHLSRAVGHEVDLMPDAAIRPVMRARVLAEALAL